MTYIIAQNTSLKIREIMIK